jgi:hypothetical protein
MYQEDFNTLYVQGPAMSKQLVDFSLLYFAFYK